MRAPRLSWSSFGAGLLVGLLLALLGWITVDAPANGPTAETSDDTQSRASDGDARGDSVSRGEPSTTHSPTRGVIDDGPGTASPRGRTRVAAPDDADAPQTGGAFDESEIVFTGESFESPSRFIAVSNTEFSGKGRYIRFTVDGKTSEWSFGRPVATNVPALLAAIARRRLAEWKSDGSEPTRGAAERLIGSDDTLDRVTGTTMAAELGTDALDLVLRVARDSSYPEVSAVAILTAVRMASHDPDVVELVIEAARSRDPARRRAAIDSLRNIGERGALAAREMLLDGDYSAAVLPSIAAAAADAPGVVGFLAKRPPTQAAWSVLLRAAATPSSPEFEGVNESFTDLVAPLLTEDESTPPADRAAVLDLLATRGHAAFLAGVIASARHPADVRVEVVRATLAHSEVHADTYSALGQLVNEPSVEPGFVGSVFSVIGSEHVQNEVVAGALRAAARTHSNPWVADEAREILRRHGLSVGGSIVIISARYGADDSYVDVVSAVRGSVSSGKLTVTSSNELGGDPLVGTLKRLLIEYEADGVRRFASITEGQTRTLP